MTYDGYIRCFDLTTGNEEWKFFVGNTTETPFGTWALATTPVAADGKIYVSNGEHTATQPRTRGNRLFCVDAFTGKGIWNITHFGSLRPIAEGYLLTTNEYDGLMYCFGKGKSETTVSAPLTAVTLGQSLTVQGTVMDLSPASAGTAAISDADMTTWMEKPIPMNVKGVEVSLDTIDPNGNFVHIGTTTSDSSGLFKKLWKPDVPGEYTVIATFAGSESYWASYAETAVGVVEAAAVTPSAETIVPDNTPIYAAIVGVGIAIIIAVAIVGILLLRKR